MFFLHCHPTQTCNGSESKGQLGSSGNFPPSDSQNVNFHSGAAASTSKPVQEKASIYRVSHKFSDNFVPGIPAAVP